ncbi:tail fiber domain-containing protein, partial [Enterobacter roggenkampii]|nr:tail fiber domain-containing protein [Enterobacter roggenkampii]
TLDDGTVVEKVLSPDTYGVAAALHHEAILALMDEIERLKAQVDNLLLAQ